MARALKAQASAQTVPSKAKLRSSRRKQFTSVSMTSVTEPTQSRSSLQSRSKFFSMLLDPTAILANRIILIAFDVTYNETGGFARYCICSDLVISAQRVNGPESFIIEIEKSKVNGLLAEFEGDLNFLAQFLRLQDKRMVLINPVRNHSLKIHAI